VNEKLKALWRTILGWVLVALGGLFVLLGWVGVSGTPAVARQMSYLVSGGIGGLVCAIVGVGLLVGEELRTERARLGRIEAALLDVREMLMSQDGRASETAEKTRRRSR
jgi:multisubunit Na+/H+ antiporter MnhG subunit